MSRIDRMQDCFIGLSKKQSKMIMGVAILFMLYHHLYCIPEKLGFPYYSVLGDWERPLSWVAKMCVAIFAFVSGYGSFCSLQKFNELPSWKKIWKVVFYSLQRVVMMLKRYWLVFLLFIPLGIGLGVVAGDVRSLFNVRTFLGLDISLNVEWWYIKQYFIMVLLLPLIHFCFEWFDRVFKCSRLIVVCAFFLVYMGTAFLKGASIWGTGMLVNLWIMLVLFLSKTYVGYTLIFLEGYVFARYDLFFARKHSERLSDRQLQRIWLLAGLLLVVFTVGLRICFSVRADYFFCDIFLIVPLIYGIWLTSLGFSEKHRLLECLGEYSSYMWLTHTFFCYYYFQRFTMITGISTVIYIQLIIVSFFTAWVLQLIQKYTFDQVGKYITQWAKALHRKKGS